MPQLHPSPLIRTLLWSAGVVALVLGAVGVFLPGLPTTPFVLVSAACFVRASPRAHAWLLANPLFGPLLREWETHRSLPRKIKRIALLSMALTVSASIWFFAGRPLLQAALAGGALVGAVAVLRIPSRD